ncbi:hypothetical protein [Streptomyces sp. NPDC056600]|uniref:hypothetical protein n=1 Tax=Streptomyces sp. NPDC056600 TaxID=3345874 RepID=UPI0036BBD4A0
MPRRPPGAVRARTWSASVRTRPFSRVPGLRRDAETAVRRLEARRFSPGFLTEALLTYEAFLRRPGRWLYVPPGDCPCCDPVQARDDVESLLHALPSGPRRQLARIVAALDAEFERRTLPDPAAAHRRPLPASPRPWWHLRLAGA